MVFLLICEIILPCALFGMFSSLASLFVCLFVIVVMLCNAVLFQFCGEKEAECDFYFVSSKEVRATGK